jgi:hypothetical protein
MNRRLRIALVLIALFILGAIVLWRISRSPPAWYRPPDALDTAVNELADRVEYRLVEEAQKVRPLHERWSLRVRENQINSWLATRLPKWLAHRGDTSWSQRAGTPQVRLEPGAISLAVPVLGGASARTVVARVHPDLVDDKLHITVDRVAVGKIALPGEPLSNLLTLIQPALPPDWEAPVTELAEALAEGQMIDPVIELADGRRVRLLAIRLDDGVLEFTAETIPPID